jgi:hypothetical protein
VTGLITLPTLQVSDTQMVFCSTAPNGQPPPVHFVEFPKTPNELQNWDPSGSGYFNMTFQLAQKGPANLNVTGVEPDGALALAGFASATTTVVVGPPQPPQTCLSSGPTMLSNLATSLAPMAPGGNAVNPPSPLTGPLAHATATLGSDNFSVPEFVPSSCIWANAVLNQALAGDTQGKNNWPCPSPTSTNCPSIAGRPGWLQFSAQTTVTHLGLPIGPPAGFSF